MEDISGYLDTIESARYGKDMRTAIHKSINTLTEWAKKGTTLCTFDSSTAQCDVPSDIFNNGRQTLWLDFPSFSTKYTIYCLDLPDTAKNSEKIDIFVNTTSTSEETEHGLNVRYNGEYIGADSFFINAQVHRWHALTPYIMPDGSVYWEWENIDTANLADVIF